MTVYIFVRQMRGCMDAWLLSWKTPFGYANVALCAWAVGQSKFSLIRQFLANTVKNIERFRVNEVPCQVFQPVENSSRAA